MACYLIVVASRLLDSVIADRLAQYGVTPGQLPTLLALYAEDGRTQAELARTVGVEQPTMALNLKRMERDGLVVRRPDPAGGRKAFVQLTELARGIEEPIRALRREIDDEATAGLSPTAQSQLRKGLAGLIDGLRGIKDPPEHS
jgi:DNA-binding MarR family transcriptional regulator